MQAERDLNASAPTATPRQITQSRWAPLATVLALALVSLALLVATHPHIPSAPDSREYLATAAKITRTGQLVDPRRTPGYPLLLALIFAFAGANNLGAVVVVQCALWLIAAVEVYLLAKRLTAHAWLACLAAAPVALNVYMLDWAYSIRDEMFSYVLIVTLFLLAERLARALRPGLVAAFAGIALLLILTRPLEIFLPALVIVALVARGALLGHWKRHVAALGLSLLLIYGCVAGYAALNGAQNGYTGISYVSDVNLFGKLMEYGMVREPVPPAMRTLQQQALSYGFHGDGTPWDFARQYGYDSDYYAPLGAFAKYVMPRHLPTYTFKTLGDVVRVWLQKPGMDAQGPKMLLFTLLRLVARAELLTYLALPLVAIWLAWLLWRGGWRSPGAFTTALLVLAALASIGMISAASFAEFYRLRAPIDWAYMLALALVATDMGGRVYQRVVHGAPNQPVQRP